MAQTPVTDMAIAVFAHNEAAHIVACLDSVRQAAGHTGRDHTVHVLNNGSSDDTAAVVQAYAVEHDAVLQHVIDIGDKANAWNHFVHETGVVADAYVFVDGDVTVDAGAVTALLDTLERHPHAHVATGVPGSGRSRARQLAMLRTAGGVQGNLYAARGDFIRAIRDRSIRMPRGFIREDGLVGAFAMYDLDPRHQKWDTARVAVAEDALFRFPSLRWYSPDDMRLYWRRRKRYSLGHFQFGLLRPLIQRAGFEAAPADIAELYGELPITHPAWRGTDTFFDWLVLRELRHPT